MKKLIAVLLILKIIIVILWLRFILVRITKSRNKKKRINNSKSLPNSNVKKQLQRMGTSCSKSSCKNSLPIFSPQFNMREVTKQCLLLEDHLNNVEKQCPDCIRKHFLIIDAYLEEAVGLETDVSKRDQLRELFVNWVEIEKLYVKDPKSPKNLDQCSRKIRIFRKPLVEKYFSSVSDYSKN